MFSSACVLWLMPCRLSASAVRHRAKMVGLLGIKGRSSFVQSVQPVISLAVRGVQENSTKWFWPVCIAVVDHR